MSQKRIGVIALTGIAMAGTCMPAYGYLLTNGSFENAATSGTSVTLDQNTPGSPATNPWYGWRVASGGTGFYAGVATDQPSSGKDGSNFVYFLRGSLQTTAALRPTAAEGKAFVATFRYKTDSASTALSAAPVAYIDFYNNNSGYTGLLASTPVTLPTGPVSPMQTYTINATAPAGATHAAVRLVSDAFQHLNTDAWSLTRTSLGVYTFSSGSTEPANSYDAFHVAPGVSMSVLSRGSGITGGSPVNSSTSNFTDTTPFVFEGGMARRGMFVRGVGINDESTDYIQFTFNPGTTAMTLTGLSLDNLLQVDSALGSYTLTGTLLSDISGAFSPVGSFSRTITSTSATGRFVENWRLDTIDLGPEFDKVESPVTFRLMLSDSGSLSTGTAAVVRFDNIALEGSVWIPEPTCLALFGLGVMIIGSRRSRA